MAAAVVAGAAVKEVIEDLTNALKSKNKVKENVQTIHNSYSELFKIRVESPEVLTLSIKKAGKIRLKLCRSDSAYMFAHVEGTVALVKSDGTKEYSRSYRSDKDGFDNKFNVNKGDFFVIIMEAHHFCSALVGQGSSEMDIKLTYD